MRRSVLLGWLIIVVFGLAACAEDPQATPTVVPIATITATPTFTVTPKAVATPGLSLIMVVLEGELTPEKSPIEWLMYPVTAQVRQGGERYQLVFPGGYFTPFFQLEWQCLPDKGCTWTAIPDISGKQWYDTSFGPSELENPGTHFVGRGIMVVKVPIARNVSIRGVIFLGDISPYGSPPPKTVVFRGGSILVEFK